MTLERGYVHGYSGREAERLVDQANALTELLHHDTRYPAGARVLGNGEPKIGAHGNPVLFLHPKDFFGTLIELEEVKG